MKPLGGWRGQRGLAQTEALRFGGFLIPEDRGDSLWASQSQPKA